MAKKTIKAAPVLRSASETDFTFRNPVEAILRFNSACVLEVTADTEQKTISIRLLDEVNGKTYQGSATLAEVE